MVKPAVYVSIFFALCFFALGTQLAYAKKTQWCIIDKKSGDYTSDCFKTREDCQKKADKKGSAFGCGVRYV